MKKHLKLLSLISLAIAGIGVSFAATQNNAFNEPEVKEAKADKDRKTIYISFDTASTWGGGNKNILDFTYCFWDYNQNLAVWTPDDYCPYPEGKKEGGYWFPYTFGDIVNHPTHPGYDDCGLIVQLLECKSGLNIIKLQVPTSADYVGNPDFTDWNYFAISDIDAKRGSTSSSSAWRGEYIPTNEVPKIEVSSLTDNAWYVINGGSGQSRTFTKKTFDSSLLDQSPNIYIDLNHTFWGQSGYNIESNNYWVKFFDYKGDRYGNDSKGYNINDDYIDSTIYTTGVTFNYAFIFVPIFARTMELHLQYGSNLSKTYSETIYIPSYNENMLVVAGTDPGSGWSGSKQTINTVVPNVDKPSTIYFKITGSQWSSQSASTIRATFYGLMGRDYQSSTYTHKYNNSNITDSSYGVLGRAVTYQGASYVAFDVPSFATHVSFNYNNSSSTETNKLLLNSNGQNTFITNGALSLVRVDTTITKHAGATAPSNDTARLFVSNNVYNGTSYAISTSSVWYGKRTNDPSDTSTEQLSDKLAIQCWDDTNPECDSDIYYFNDKVDGLGLNSSGNRTYNCFYYVDIPVTCTRFRFIVMSATGKLSSATVKYGASLTEQVNDETFTYCYYLYPIDTTYTEFVQYAKTPLYDSVRSAGDYKVGLTFAQRLFEAYDTCDTCKKNGCGNISLLKSNLLLNMSSTITSSAAYTLNSDIPYSIGEIISSMEKRAVSGSSSAISIARDYEKDSSRIVIIIVISSLSLVSILAMTLYINKKRKHS